MTRARSVFVCDACGETAARWSGRCAGCGEWNTLAEIAGRPNVASAPATEVRPIGQVALDGWRPRPTEVHELDRVLAGGLVPGSVTLLGGEPGIGKSTLVLQVAAALARAGRRVLYVSAEESAPQVRLRADRLGALHDELWLAAEGSLDAVLRHLDLVGPELMVIDSIQTIHTPDLDAPPGTVGQVRACTHQLVQEAKRRGLAVVLVGHVTKDGALAGPRALEHAVDTVLAFEGDRHHALRLLRAVKHRFGSTHELGVFEMTDSGLVAVPDASGMFLADRHAGVPGSVVVPTLDGHRPLLVEIQALVVRTSLPSPRRSAQGLDAGRLPLLLAVLGKRAGVSVADHDVYALAVGGVRVAEPGADLATALAVASAHTGDAVPGDIVACGEVGLGGELRQVAQTVRRLTEAARLGFRRAIVPASAPDPPPGVVALRAATLSDALRLAGVRVEHAIDGRSRAPAAA